MFLGTYVKSALGIDGKLASVNVISALNNSHMLPSVAQSMNSLHWESIALATDTCSHIHVFYEN